MHKPGVIFDIGGVLLDGKQPLEGARQALQLLDQAGIRYGFLTNTTSKNKRQLLHELSVLGREITPYQLTMPADVARVWLLRNHYQAWPLVADTLLADFADLPGEQGGAVVIGDLGERFNYALLNEAFQRIEQGAPLLALGKTRFYQRDGQRHLDSGPFVHALEYATGIEAIVCGKPDARAFLAAADHLGVAPEHCCMIGDDAAGDVQAAIETGLAAVLVRTGKYQAGDEHDCTQASVEDDALSAVQAIVRQNTESAE